MRKIKTLKKADGSAQVTIYLNFADVFTFAEEVWTKEEHPSLDTVDEYWLPTYSGGLYASAEEAEQDARAAIPWLRSHSVD